MLKNIILQYYYKTIRVSPLNDWREVIYFADFFVILWLYGRIGNKKYRQLVCGKDQR